MELKTFFKSTEAIIVFSGLFLTVINGKFWAIATAVAYFLVNVPNAVGWLKSKLKK